MKPNQNLRLQLMPMTLAAGLMVSPMIALAQSTPTPPAAASRPAATPAVPDGAPGNPPGTAVGRAVDRATGSAAAPATGAPAALAPAGSAIVARPRMSQIIGASIYNERDEAIGEVEDILITPPSGMSMPRSAATAAAPAASTTVPLVPGAPPAVAPPPSGPVAIIQVGGFLGMGGRLVTVPLADLRWNGANEHIVLSGATKESLQRRPAFEYSMLRPR